MAGLVLLLQSFQIGSLPCQFWSLVDILVQLFNINMGSKKCKSHINFVLLDSIMSRRKILRAKYCIVCNKIVRVAMLEKSKF